MRSLWKNGCYKTANNEYYVESIDIHFKLSSFRTIFGKYPKFLLEQWEVFLFVGFTYSSISHFFV